MFPSRRNTAREGFAQKKVSGTFRRSRFQRLLGWESSRHLFLGKACQRLKAICTSRLHYSVDLLKAALASPLYPGVEDRAGRPEDSKFNYCRKSNDPGTA